jgi:hypothetical protein
VQESEALLAAYDSANRDAAQRVKALEAALKARDAEMADERRALERDVVRAAEAAHADSADTAQKLRCARARAHVYHAAAASSCKACMPALHQLLVLCVWQLMPFLCEA